MDISYRMFEHVKCVRQSYANHLQDLRGQKQQNEKDKQKSLVESEVKNVEEQIHDIEKVIKRLEEKFIAFVEDHEKKKNFHLYLHRILLKEKVKRRRKAFPSWKCIRSIKVKT